MADLSALQKFSSDVTSKLNIKPPSKEQKKKAAAPVDEEVVEVINVAPNSGYADPPTKDKDARFPADYYRFGRVERDAEGRSFFAEQPRFIDEWNANNQKDQLAAIRLITKKNGKEQELIPRFTKFILGNVQESHVERSQVVETFGEFYVFFYGERPPVYNFSGVLINTVNANWYGDFQFYYEKFLRGTRAVEQQAVIRLSYQGRQIEGFILNSSTSLTSEIPNGVSFQFQVLVTDRTLVNVSADFGLIETDGIFTKDDFLGRLTEGLSIPNISKAYDNAKKATNSDQPAASTKQPKSTSLGAMAKEYGAKLLPNQAGNLIRGIG